MFGYVLVYCMVAHTMYSCMCVCLLCWTVSGRCISTQWPEIHSIYNIYMCVEFNTHTHGEQVKMTESTRRATQRAHALDYVCFTILYSLWYFVVGLFLVRFASIVYYYSVESRQWTNSTRAYRKHRRERPTECVCVL